MGLFNTFFTEWGDIQVKCHDYLGGSCEYFNLNDEVPTNKLDLDFNEAVDFGLNHNIFCYTQEVVVLFVRNGIYQDYCFFDKMDKKNCIYPCIDKEGNFLDLKTPEDYIKIKKEFEQIIKENNL